ncbi:MAG: hypothetical protein KC503_17525 [Myxococcales bacterium]|nr:hypothetical protein [Myxococcales bacterium]
MPASKPDQAAHIRAKLEAALYALWRSGATTRQLATMCEDLAAQLGEMAHEDEALARRFPRTTRESTKAVADLLGWEVDADGCAIMPAKAR